jgi:CHAD domain-containing protein
VDHISGELRWIGGLLGAVRDAELVETRLGDLGIPPGSTGVSLHLLEARATLTTAFGADRYRTLYDDLAAFAITPRFGSGDRGNRWLVGRVRREIDRTVDLARVAAELDGPARALGLHDVRRSARRVRYAAETLEPRYGGRARAVVKGFKSVQRTLGTHHDAIVLLAAFSDGSVTLPADPSGEVDRSPIARTQLLVAEAEARFWAVWPDIEAETHRRWPMG